MGQSPLSIKGETRMNLTRNAKRFFLEALVVENIDVDILAGVPFMACNDISVRPAKHQIIIGDGTTYEYGAITLNVNNFATKKSRANIGTNPIGEVKKESEPINKIEELKKQLEEIKNM